jgi:hypothetical protein
LSKKKKRETHATFIDNRLAYENRLVIRVCFLEEFWGLLGFFCMESRRGLLIPVCP